MKNLDYLAAHAGQQMTSNAFHQVKDRDKVENLVKKTLGIVQEAGAYAALVFLMSRAAKEKDNLPTEEAKIARAIYPALVTLANQVLPATSQVTGTHYPQILASLAEQVCKNLDRVLLVRQLWEQSLIYARYGSQSL